MAAKLALLDTNLFLLWLVGQRNTTYIGMHKRTNKFSIRDFENLNKFLVQMDEVATTSQVMVEVSNLLAQTDDEKRSELRLTFQAVLSLMPEHHQAARALANGQYFIRLGLTDAGLLDESLRDHLLVTADGPLHSTACELGHSCIHFNEIREFS